MSKKIPLLFTLLFLLLLDISGASVADEGKSLTIVYTNDVIGEIEPCG